MGRAGTNWGMIKNDHPDWVETGFARPLVQLTTKSIPGLDGIPLVMNYVKDESSRQIMDIVLGMQKFSRIFSVAPGTPPERLAILREAFAKMVADPEFIEEGKTFLYEGVQASDHEAIENFIHSVYAMPQEVRDHAAEYVGSD